MRYTIHYGASQFTITDRKVGATYNMAEASSEELSAVASNIAKEKGLK